MGASGVMDRLMKASTSGSSAVIAVRVDARVSSVGGAGAVRAVSAFWLRGRMLVAVESLLNLVYKS